MSISGILGTLSANKSATVSRSLSNPYTLKDLDAGYAQPEANLFDAEVRGMSCDRLFGWCGVR